MAGLTVREWVDRGLAALVVGVCSWAALMLKDTNKNVVDVNTNLTRVNERLESIITTQNRQERQYETLEARVRALEIAAARR